MILEEKKEILTYIKNCKIIAINIVDKLLEFVYIKNDKEKYITVEFDGVTGSMGRHYFFNIQSYKSDDKFIKDETEVFELFKNIKTVSTIKLKKYTDFEYSSETIELVAIFDDDSKHKITLYSDDEDSYIDLDKVCYTYYDSNKDGLVWKR